LAFDLEPHAMEPSIQFADDALRPVRSDAGHDIGGVVRLRSKASLRVGRSSSVDVAKVAELEDVQDEDAGLRDERDFKRSQSFSISQVFLLAYQSVGVIYGDIGTSPLYVFSSTFTQTPVRADLLGALSLILWTITLMVTIKYILIILHADNDGEGGTFSTYSLLSKYANISNRDPREATLIRECLVRPVVVGRWGTHYTSQA